MAAIDVVKCARQGEWRPSRVFAAFGRESLALLGTVAAARRRPWRRLRRRSSNSARFACEFEYHQLRPIKEKGPLRQGPFFFDLARQWRRIWALANSGFPRVLTSEIGTAEQ